MIVKDKRPAIAMIELIFAIVVMGIVMMSAPMLISTATQSVSVALQQEGINEGSSRVSMIMTYAWDENDTNDSCIPPVLLTTVGDSELNITANHRRIGVPASSNSRTFLCGARELNASTTLGSEAGEVVEDDLDDFSDTSLVLDTTGAGGKDYIETGTVNLATNVNYIVDDANYSNATITYTPGGTSGGTTNIKSITVIVTSTSSASELKKNITLKAFSCNIGGYEFESRVFQ